MMNLNYLRLLVDDFPACFHFYAEVLGLPVRMGSTHDVYAEFATGEATLALFRRELMSTAIADTSSRSASPSKDNMVIILAVSDVDAAFDTIRARSATFITSPQDRPEWGIRTAHLRDPQGNLVEINGPLAQPQG